MDKVILQCGGGWPTNIGNAFLDYGVKYLLKEIMPEEYSLNITSNAINWIYSNYGKKNNFMDVSSIAKADYFVFAGSMLAENWFKEHENLFNNLCKNKSPILMIGVSGETYNENETNFVRKYLEKLNIELFISRDEKCFNHYGEIFKSSYNGIDSAFFLNSAFKPLKLNSEEYSIFCFDGMSEPNIRIKEKVVRTHHAPWKVLSNNFFSKKDLMIFAESLKNSQRDLIKKTDMISDLPEDYLNLYANCKNTYSDRIHACVASLAFGNSAKLYSNSNRSFLFDRIRLSKIRNELVKLNQRALNKEKKMQIKFISDELSF